MVPWTLCDLCARFSPLVHTQLCMLMNICVSMMYVKIHVWCSMKERKMTVWIISCWYMNDEKATTTTTWLRSQGGKRPLPPPFKSQGGKSPHPLRNRRKPFSFKRFVLILALTSIYIPYYGSVNKALFLIGLDIPIYHKQLGLQNVYCEFTKV